MEGCCPRVAAILEEGEPDALTYYDFPPLPRRHLRANNVQERANRKIKCGSRMMQSFPSAASLARLAGAVMCEQDEIWQESRYCSEAKMSKLCDEARTRGVDGTVDWARLEVEAGKMIESGLELADRIEAVQDINRIPVFWTPGRLASDRALHQLSRHYPILSLGFLSMKS